MKKICFAVFLTALTIGGFAQTKKPVAKKPMAKKTITKKNSVVGTKSGTIQRLKTQLDSASYAFGSSVGAGIKSNGIDVMSYDIFMMGLKDAFTGKNLILDPQKAQKVINEALVLAKKNKFKMNITEGKTFLEENKKRAGVQVTASGIQYEVLRPGTGVKPKATDSVLVHYKGTLLNGKQFDSSYDRGEPISFPLNRVITGWTEGVQLMPAGSKYKFYIPYELAYGENGAGKDIPPYSTLIFEIELLKVNGK
ncbi:FKBP-type peptidyl-prolyl cis-trans isomerase [Pedobacter changchengzhani]|uniref:Peptidyl-prolyl cis-trans isomerase n=1 Tax=Pedobacter changchengzhani TaxID=2529274 RepID=A0A4R5MQ01_9SPHI|nr:FKBP-type peptidyl-prolyl cis-trans isomerase [Pedobacter changchengzhani]TDG37957.1 FKBP-type peptidyl-prolyl cis-trans isomerase [Pedobacter changchengzhani]